MDLSKLSDQDLQALKAKNLRGVSDQGLQYLKAQSASAQPGASAANPIEADLYGDGSKFSFAGGGDRAAASFGDLEGNAPKLQKNGFKNPQKNGAGDTVVQGPDGKFYKDATSFTKHPINWLEAHAGAALPTAGMVGGGAMGEGVASIPLAGAGAALGEGARAGIGKALGVYKGGLKDASSDAALEGAGGMAAEAGGKLIGKVPIPGTGLSIDEATKMGLQKLLHGGLSVGARAQSILTGVDKDAYMRMYLRPDEVSSALRPGNAKSVLNDAQAELGARSETENRLISEARMAARTRNAGVPVNTQPAVDAANQAIQRNPLNRSGRGGMTQAELSELADIRDRDLMGTRTVKPEVPPVEATEVSFQEPPKPTFREKVGNVIAGRPLPDAEPKMSIGGKYTVKPGEPAVTEPVARQGFEQLMGTADHLQNEIPPSTYDHTLPGARKPKSVGAMQDVLGKLKQALHLQDPAYGAADARFSRYADDAKLLGPIERDASGESFIDNMFGKNKTGVQEAAQNLIPHSYERATDIGAAKALDRDRISKLGPSAPALIRGLGLPGLGAAALSMGTSGSMEGGLLGLGLGTGAAVITSPTTQKYFAYLAGKVGVPVAQKLAENPQLAPLLLDSKEAKNFATNVWGEMRSKMEGK
jgi:hypothetical protein